MGWWQMSAAGAVTTDLVDSATYAKESQDFRHQIGHVSRHSSVFLLGTVFAGISGYMFKIYLAREIGPEALGLYALGMTMVGFVGIFSEVGLPQAAVRFVAAYSATGRWRELATFLLSALALLMAINLLCAGVLATAGRWFAVHFYHAPELAAYMWMFAGLAFFAGMNTFFGHVLAGYKHISRRTIITNFVSSPVSIGLTVLLVSLGTGLWGYSIAQLITSSVAFVLLSASLWKLRPRAAFNGVPIQLRL